MTGKPGTRINEVEKLKSRFTWKDNEINGLKRLLPKLVGGDDMIIRIIQERLYTDVCTQSDAGGFAGVC